MVAHRIAAFLAVAIATFSLNGPATAATACPDLLTSAFPDRPPEAQSGSEFARRMHGLSDTSREAEIASELLAGNVPNFLRHLKPVTLHREMTDGRETEITICVAPDYLSIGSDADFLRVPMGLPTAIATAVSFGFTLPTREMVDAIYEQAKTRFSPQPLPAGDRMRSTAYYVAHNQRIAAQRKTMNAPLGPLMAGHKKDLVITNRLWANPGRVAIYGWHWPDGRPIQPLSTVHGARYADYSHGVRLVSLVAYVDGQPRSLLELLDDPRIAGILNDEGRITHAIELVRALGGSGIDATVLAQEAKRLVQVAQAAGHAPALARR